MLKEWATVESWENGVAYLRCEAKSGCGGCQARNGCGTRILNELGSHNSALLPLKHKTPLQAGQRVELGFPEGNLLISAFVVYMLPLFGLMLFGGVMQWGFGSDLAAVIGAAIGGWFGFILARRILANRAKKQQYQPMLLQVQLPVTQVKSLN